MKRLTPLILLLPLMAVSCNKSEDGSPEGSSDSTAVNVEAPAPATHPTDMPAPNPTPPPTPPPGPNGGTVPDPTAEIDQPTPAPVSTLPAMALSFQSNIKYLSGFEDADVTKYNRAVEILKKVVATEAFRSAVLNHTYNGAKTYVQNNGLTNAQIYQTILDAAEKLTPAKNNTIDVGVKLYYENSSIVGYTSPSISYINVNTKFFDSYVVNSVAANLFHEWLHKVGYGHDSAATARRPYSVPYAVGYMIGKIGQKFL